jgi:hypothetical protein
LMLLESELPQMPNITCSQRNKQQLEAQSVHMCLEQGCCLPCCWPCEGRSAQHLSTQSTQPLQPAAAQPTCSEVRLASQSVPMMSVSTLPGSLA